MSEEKMTAERLAEMRRRLSDGRYMDVDPITELLAEVDRLRAAAKTPADDGEFL